MTKSLKRIISVVLCAVMLFSCSTAASAIDIDKEGITSSAFTMVADILTKGLNAVVDGVLNVVSSLIPASVKVKDPSEYTSDNFMPGNEEFIDAPAEGAAWSLGYSSASIIPDDFSKGIYCKGGYTVNKKLTDCLDDLRVRVIALNDGSGRGTAVFAIVDGLGLANSDVRRIRAAVADYARENNIVSINVSATHVHSGIDTQGIYTDTFNNVFKNLGMSILGSENLAEPVNPKFLQHLINQTAHCIKEAEANMTQGKLLYAHTDINEYVRDRTAPDISLDELYRLEFLPDNGSKPTMIANFGVHPEAIGFKHDVATADFVYYTEKVVNAAGYNFIYIQGAVGTITERMDLSNDGLSLDRIEATKRYGEEIGYILLSMTESMEYCISITDPAREALAAESEGYTPWYENHVTVRETEVEPILNIKHAEYMVPVENGVYKALGKVALANNAMYIDKRTNEMTTSTEVGYMELGSDIKVILCPGETYAELIKGGENMEGFAYDTAYDIMGTEDVLVFDLMNDAAGYIMPDDYFTYLTVTYGADGLSIGHSWGLTSLGKHAASNIYGEIYKLYESVK